MNFDRRLIYASFAAFVVYMLYLFFGPDYVAYPLPSYTSEEALAKIEQEAEKLGLEPIPEENIYYKEIVANSSLGRYIDANELSEEELLALHEEVAIQTFEVSSFLQVYGYDMEHERLTKAESIYLEKDPDQFVAEYFGEQYEPKGKETDIFGDTILTYVKETKYPDILDIVEVTVNEDVIIGFEQYGLARGFPKAELSVVEMLASLFVLFILIGLVAVATIHLIVKSAKKQIEAFWEPLMLTAVAGFGWFFITKALGSGSSFFSMIETLMMIYLTLVALLIRWKKSTLTFRERLIKLQPSVVHGLALMFISVLLSEAFFFFAKFFDAWGSPVTSHIVLSQLDLWLIPVFTLFIGLSAAITEEAVFRNYLVPIFDRVGVLFSLVLTSFLWGIFHIGYHMYPWYLYVLEFIVITGPLFYFAYKRYGFTTAIFLHYFYNAWVTTIFLFTVDVKVALVSLFVTLSPFLVFLAGKNEQAWQPEM